MSTHLEELLQRDLDRIRISLTRMAELAVRTLRDCLVAFESQDRELAYAIILRDQRIDCMEKDIDQLCLQFIVRHQPAAGHLRFAYAALQINFELERIGDYAESIARQILKLIELKEEMPAGLFTEIARTSVSMLHDAITAFVRQDAELAVLTAQTEERVDALRNQVSSELMRMLERKQIALEALTPFMTIARRFERVSDQAKSICQETIYICTGEYAKHQGEQVYRVLFVDDQGVPARLAQALGQRLHRSEFIFASASVEPSAPSPEALQYLGGKGFDASPEAPVRLSDVGELYQFQVLIALSPSARAQLPRASRKLVTLEWQVPPASAGEGQPGYAGLEGFLSARITRFVKAVLGEEQL